MPTEQDVKFSDYIRGLPAATNISAVEIPVKDKATSEVLKVDGNGIASVSEANEPGILKTSITDVFKTRSSETTNYKGVISDLYGWYRNPSDIARHVSYRIKEGYRVVVSCDKDAYLATLNSSFVEGDQVNGSTVPYSTTRPSRILVKANTPYEFIANADEAFVVLTTQGSSGTSYEWDVLVRRFELKYIVDDVISAIYPNVDDGDTEDIDKYKGSVGPGYWYRDQSDITRHVSIRLNEGDKVYAVCSSAAYVARLNGNFIEGDQANNSKVHFSSSAPARVLQPANTPYEFTAKKDDNYLVFNVVGGSGSVFSWHYRIERFFQRSVEDSFVRIKVGTWNVGGFSMGYQPTTTILPDEKESKKIQYREFINSVGLDVLGVCEDEENFCTDGTKSRDIVWNCFDNKIQGTKIGYNMNSIYSNGVKIISSRKVFFTGDDAYRYFTEIKVRASGKEFFIVESHNDWSNVDNRLAQFNQLIETYQNEERVVIMGDFNFQDKTLEEVPIFLNAGYTAALCDYIGFKVTRPYNGRCIDNIFAKGFLVENVKVYDSSELSDHNLVSCVLVLKN